MSTADLCFIYYTIETPKTDWSRLEIYEEIPIPLRGGKARKLQASRVFSVDPGSYGICLYQRFFLTLERTVRSPRSLAPLLAAETTWPLLKPVDFPFFFSASLEGLAASTGRCSSGPGVCLWQLPQYILRSFRVSEACSDAPLLSLESLTTEGYISL